MRATSSRRAADLVAAASGSRPRFLDAPPEGPPGTLGAIEQITFADVPAGTTVDASLVAHTWGTETLLEIEGAALGETFEVLLVDHDGARYGSGSFIGTEATVVCAMNAAVHRTPVDSPVTNVSRRTGRLPDPQALPHT